MAEDKLEKLLNELLATPNPSKGDFDTPLKLKKDAEDNVASKLNKQIPVHRTVLLGLIISLTIASFLLLAGVVIFQMWKRIDYPEYQGVSDTVINILATGVFAELVGVIGIIVRFVWRDPK